MFVPSSSAVRLVFRFAHSTALLQTATNLGLLPNEVPPPLPHNFLAKRDRHFRSSRFAPFAANLGLALLSCGSENRSFVVPLLQERSLAKELCGAERCSLRKVLEKYEFCAQPDYHLDRLCALALSATVVPKPAGDLLASVAGWHLIWSFGFLKNFKSRKD